MNVFDVIILAVIQGITEFLPISSSGHLVLAQSLLGFTEPMLTFDIVLHLGSLVSVLIYYRRQLQAIITSFWKWLFHRSTMTESDNYHFGFIPLVIIATIPATIIGLLFKDIIEQLFTSPKLVSVSLCITAVILYITQFQKKGDSNSILWWQALIIGIAQAFAITPGISRSGSTIAASVLLGVKPEKSAEFSFLLSIPAIVGAFILSLGEISHSQSDTLSLTNMLLGASIAGIVGYYAIKYLIVLLSQRKLHWFSYYLMLVGGIGLLWS